MRCGEVLERMLEAEPAALRGDAAADPDLAAHLGGCVRCRAVADALAIELDALDRGIGEAAWARGGRRRVGSGPGARGGSRWAHRAAWWIPLAAAAALATVVVMGRIASPEPGATGAVVAPADGPATTAPPAHDPERAAIRLPADGGAVVMNTGDPRITVVWFYERSEG